MCRTWHGFWTLRSTRMKCACHCGEEFEPERSNQKYVNAEHRQRDKNRRWPVRRQSKDVVASRNGRGMRQQPQTSGVTPLLGTELAQTKRERLKAKNGRRAGTEKRCYTACLRLLAH